MARRSSARAALPRVSVRWAVGAIVGVSALLQAPALAWRRPTPGYFPTSTCTPSSGARSSRPARHSSAERAHFLPLLYPLDRARLALDDVEQAYRTMQAFNAVAMSLGRGPAFLLARRLRVGDRLALAAAALTVVLPELLSTPRPRWPRRSPIRSRSRLPRRPWRRWSGPRLASSSWSSPVPGLAALTRLQLAVLPLCYLAAVLAVGVRDRRLRSTVREHRLAVGAITAVVVVGVGAALSGTVGSTATSPLTRSSRSRRRRGSAQTRSSSPMRPAGCSCPARSRPRAALGRPRRRAELGFGFFAVCFVVLLLAQAPWSATRGGCKSGTRCTRCSLVVAFVLYARAAGRGCARTRCWRRWRRPRPPRCRSPDTPPAAAASRSCSRLAGSSPARRRRPRLACARRGRGRALRVVLLVASAGGGSRCRGADPDGARRPRHDRGRVRFPA